VSGTPVTRLICHCTICHALYKQPFADVTVWWAGAIVLPEHQQIQFKRHRAPPALQRGTCAACGAPVVGSLRLASFVKLAFVPRRILLTRLRYPPPARTFFITADLRKLLTGFQKISGYWPSQLVVTRLVVRSVWGRVSDV
jgi:hypothetical protein